jgi:two-component system sensor histidine kinase RegB
MSANDTFAAGAAANLRRLLLLRLIVFAGFAAAMVFAATVLRMTLPLWVPVTTFAALVAVSLLALRHLRAGRPIVDAELFAHLVSDVAGLTVLLYCTGGSTNPFAPLYLVPLTFAAAMLPGFYAWGMTGISVACYSLLLVFYVPLPETHLAHDAFHVHVLGMWFGFLFGAILIAHFAVRMRETLRERDQLRAHMNEQALRHERVLALGTLAAGAAHELATPLSTIAVTVGELVREGAAPPARLESLRTQIARCKQILGLLTAKAGHARAEGGESMPLDRYVQQALARFQATRPQARVHTDIAGSAAPVVVADETLTQALLSVVANAADVSADQIEVRVRWTAQELMLDVLDRGPGVPASVLEHVGEPFFTTKAAGEGMGLGLFLARSTVERLGGSVVLANRSGGGAVCSLRLPLAALMVVA